jgi:hypothetical protein
MKLNKYLTFAVIAMVIAVAAGLYQPVRENLAIQYKPYTGLDYPNRGDIGSLANATVAKCKTACTRKPDCVGFTMNPDSTCYFKNISIRTPGYGEGTFYYGGDRLPPGVTDPTEYENKEWEAEEEEVVVEQENPTRNLNLEETVDTPVETPSNTGMYVGIGIAVVAVVLIGGAAFVFLRPSPAPVIAGRRR